MMFFTKVILVYTYKTVFYTIKQGFYTIILDNHHNVMARISFLFGYGERHVLVDWDQQTVAAGTARILYL